MVVLHAWAAPTSNTGRVYDTTWLSGSIVCLIMYDALNRPGPPLVGPGGGLGLWLGYGDGEGVLCVGQDLK
jgi:hypothetical protein